MCKCCRLCFCVAIFHLNSTVVITMLVIQAFTIEGQDEAELPEELLCAMRFHNVDMVNDEPLESVQAKYGETQEETKGGGMRMVSLTNFWTV